MSEAQVDALIDQLLAENDPNSTPTIDFLGAPGCAFLVTNPFVLHFTATDANGLAEANLPLPSALPPNVVMWAQWLALEPTANQLGVVMSNGARITIF